MWMVSGVPLDKMCFAMIPMNSTTITPNRLQRLVNRLACVSWSLLALLGLSLPAQAFVFDSFGDGFWKVINQANSGALVVTATNASQAVTGTAGFEQQFELLYNLDTTTFRLRNRDSWQCIGARNAAATNGTPVVEITYNAAASQRWQFQDVGGGYYRIVNAASGLALQTDGATPAKVTLQPSATNTLQYWRFTYQTHYPKKGTAGYDGDWAKFGASWSYNWGRFGASVPDQVVFEPMQWGPWWPSLSALPTDSVAWRQSAKPIYLLGFNEPDHTDQANMSVQWAIDLWPQLQAANVPLLSPACANAYGGWLGDFYTRIASLGYRVDFTGVHWYGSPNAGSLISHLQSVYNSWGRAVWLTEFSPVDWGGTATWTEEDNYRFLAEFMWRAEDLVWFKRYSIFAFTGTPSANPWDRNGHRGDMFQPGGAFTPYGELYAAWDADRTLRTQTPYLIQNPATSHRLSSLPAQGGPLPASIRHSDVAAQWTLLSAPASRFYIQSLRDGRRLRCVGSALDLAPTGTVSTNVEWTFNGPDANGYYYVDNPANSRSLRMDRANDGNGAPTSLTFGTSPFGTVGDNTRWRFVKAYYPVSLAAAATPTNLTATAGDRRVVLRWSGSAPRFHVYRGTVAGGPYTRLVSDLLNNVFCDNSALNGITYRYVVTAVNGLEQESTYSNEASATPAITAAPPGLQAEYKFENSTQDSSGNGFHGLSDGGTSFVAGRVDSSALSFNGTDAYVEIPNPVAGDFSVAFWMKTTATASGGHWWAGRGLVDGEVAGATNDWGVALVGTKVAFGVGNPDVTISNSTAINDGAPHHVVATRLFSSGLMRLYVDGVLRASGSGPSGTRGTPTSLRLGGIRTGYGLFNGALDEVRLYNYALSQPEVTKLANAGAALVAQYKFEGNAVDSSGFGNTGTTNGVTFVPGKVDSLAAQFDGTNGFVQIPDSVANDFSLACWVKSTATGGSGQWWNGKGLVDGEVSGAAADFGLTMVGGRAAFGVGNTDFTITSGRTINDGQWHHVAATRNNTKGAMRLYVDGALQALGNGPTNTRTAPTALRIGSLQPGNGLLAGALDEVRLYNYILHPNQIAALVTPQPLPAPWLAADLGAPGSEGYALYNSLNGIWTLGGSGADIWLTSDQCHFAHRSYPGDGSLVARVSTAATNSDGSVIAFAKAGVMFRASLSANAPFVGLFHAQTAGLQMLYRDSTGATAGQVSTNRLVGVPCWLRLVRSNNTFSAYYATTTGTPAAGNWILLGAHDTVMTSDALAGAAVCSHDNLELATATFASLSVAPLTPPVISAVPPQTIRENTSTELLPVTLANPPMTADYLLLTAASSDQMLVPNNFISLGGSGSNRTVQVTPVSNYAGTATITLMVNNGQLSTNTSFLLTVETTPAGAWRQQWFGTTANADSAADSADPDNDRVSNLWERALNLNPTVADTNAWPVGSVQGDAFALTYRRNLLAPDLVLQPQWSLDLAEWSTNHVTDLPISTNGATELRVGTVPATTGNPLFLRLQLTPNNSAQARRAKAVQHGIEP